MLAAEHVFENFEALAEAHLDAGDLLRLAGRDQAIHRQRYDERGAQRHQKHYGKEE